MFDIEIWDLPTMSSRSLNTLFRRFNIGTKSCVFQFNATDTLIHVLNVLFWITILYSPIKISSLLLPFWLPVVVIKQTYFWVGKEGQQK